MRLRARPSGIRTATVFNPAVTEEGREDFFESKRVRGPGQKRAISVLARGGTSLATLLSIFMSLTCTITGLSCGRPFAAKILATAPAFSAFAPRP
jgi:hypothetical protein